MVKGDGRASRRVCASNQQRRVKLISSVVKSLQYIKLSALEPVVTRVVGQSRDFEISERTYMQAQGRVVCLLAYASPPVERRLTNAATTWANC